MLRPITLILALVLSSVLSVQAQNAFSFDGTDDFGAATNGSAVISGASAFSMSMWVYPETLVSGYPDFGGMGGFRNESNCDFYILQLASSNVEARLRNSAGSVYTITYNSGMNMNAWNHFTLVFNGSSLILYHDGTAVSSIPASGSITNSSVPFNVGYVPFSGANFHFDGIIDDLGLWDKALSATEVSDLYNGCGYDLTKANLKIAYEFNQGLANGTNTSISSFADGKSSYNATISGAALSGTSSNFVNGLSSSFSDSLTLSVCKEYISPSGMVYTSNAIFTDSLLSSSGCDSIFYIDLTVSNIDSSVSQSGDTLWSNDTSATTTYQWINCNSGQAISGVTSRRFRPTISGTYAVVVQNNACTDTSACYTVNVSGVSLAEMARERLGLYPNPARDKVYLEGLEEIQPMAIRLIDPQGKLIRSEDFKPYVELSALPAGLFMIQVAFKDGSSLNRSLLIRD